MMTIEDEIQHLINFLSHPCGFEVALYAMLQIRPIDEYSPPQTWEVSWHEVDGDIEIDSYKEFTSLQEAAQFFVEKRRFKCLGADFETIILNHSDPDVEID